MYSGINRRLEKEMIQLSQKQWKSRSFLHHRESTQFGLKDSFVVHSNWSTFHWWMRRDWRGDCFSLVLVVHIQLCHNICNFMYFFIIFFLFSAFSLLWYFSIWRKNEWKRKNTIFSKNVIQSTFYMKTFLITFFENNTFQKNSIHWKTFFLLMKNIFERDGQNWSRFTTHFPLFSDQNNW